MKLKLKENPNEWRKFTAVMAGALAVLAWLLQARGILPRAWLVGGWAVLASAVVLSLLAPRWFRGFYRVGMTVSFHIGQAMGKVLLTLFFLLVLTPLGLLLRLFGQDLLKLKRNRTATTYWQPTKTNREFDRLF